MVKKNTEKDKKIIKTELAFYVHTHNADKLSRPKLFKLANIDMSTMLENLSILLMNVDNNARSSSVAEILLPTNEDALNVLSNDPQEKEPHVYEINKLCVNVWHEGETINWYLGYFTSIKEENIFVVEQLVRAGGSDLMWVHPSTPVFEDIDSDQVLRCKNGKLFPVKGNWNYERLNKFVLKNKDDICKAFESFKVNFQ